jgi:hypothetical protein
LPKKIKDNVISLIKKTKGAKKYPLVDLFNDVANSDISDEYNRAFIFVLNDKEKMEDGQTLYKFNYFNAGFKNRPELVGFLEMCKNVIVDELFE